MRMVTKGEPDQYFPVAHTCFNDLELPRYSSFEVMKQRIVWAIENTTAIDGDRVEHGDIAWDT